MSSNLSIPLRIAVLGAGAMGSVFGARLAIGGAEVTLLDVNDAHLDAIKAHGLQVDLDGTNHRLDLPAMRPEVFRGPVDVVLLFTKIFHTDAALKSIASVLPDTYALSLQNGIGNGERINAAVPKERILLGMTLTPAEFLGAGRVASHGAASTSFYAMDGTARPILNRLADALTSGGIDANLAPDIQQAIWEKAIFNCAMNALCALSNGTPGSIGVSDQGRALAFRVVHEAVAVAQAGGINARVEKIKSLMNHAFTHHLLHEPSMLQDRNARRRTEIEALNGAVATQGEALGIPVPVNRTLTDLISLMEVSYAYRERP